MVIDSMRTLAAVRARKAEHIVTSRDLDGYFDHVWSVHPLVGADPDEYSGSGTGSPTMASLNAAHTVVEGTIRRSSRLTGLPHLNFVLAQVELVLMLDGIVQREGVDIVRGDPYYHGLLALLLGRRNGCAVEIRILANFDAIYETVGALAYPRLFRRRAIERRVAHFTLSRADAVLSGSDDNREFAAQNGARPECQAYVGNWTMISPVHREEPARRELLGDELGFDDRPVVACVTRLERMKHPEDVVVAIAKAHRRDPRIAGVLVGDGAMRDELSALCNQLGVRDHVVFTGDRDQPWIARLLTASTVVVAPHAGLALVESALSGTPIVAYDHEWHSELIRSEQEGILVAYRDTDAMAGAICALVDDPARAARLGAAARARALDKMDPSKLLAHERDHAAQLLLRTRSAIRP